MPSNNSKFEDGTRPSGLVKSPDALAAGLFLLGIAAIGFFGTSSISVGTVAEFGAGMVPRAVTVLLGVCGALLIGMGFTVPGARLERWSMRGLICVLGSVIAFGLTIRGFNFGAFKLPTLGLVVAGPLAVSLASLADPDTRPREIAIFAFGLTALCVLMFRFILRLPIPIAPWLVGY
ncbi:MAG: tripartite tricarboxylate transporter TctB family protein [Hyphomicrobiaceae bacterium]